MGKPSDLKGKKFGRLLCLRPTEKRKGRKVVWECLCDCGNIVEVLSTCLKSGGTKSCGCWRVDSARKVGKLPNRSLPKGLAAFNGLFGQYRHSAIKRGLFFNLTKKEFRKITKQECHYCGQAPSNNYYMKDLNGTYTYNGLDRVDNTKGYLIDNVVSCCKQCNYMKHTQTRNNFLDQVKRIANKHRL